MKKLKSIILALSFLAAAGCDQEVLDQQPPEVEEEPTPTAGTANFSKYVAIGTSISAGYQAGALFTDGQNESMGAILAGQFAGVNSNAAFVQPSINSANGFNSSFSNVGLGVFRGRMILFDPDGTGPRTPSPTPSASTGGTAACTGVITPALPAPYNTAQTLPQVLTPVTGSFNNFSVPGIVLAQILTPATGGPTSSNPAFNPYYRRFASAPSNDGTTGSTILGDALTAVPTFFTFEFGFNEVVGFAAAGGPGTNTAPSSGHPTLTYAQLLGAAMTNILGAPPGTSKGVIVNVPDVTKLPHFSLVPWNSIVLPNQATIDATNTAYAAYNAGLDAALTGGYPGLTAEEVAKRKIVFTSGKNGVVILDETLTNLTPLNAALVNMRMATAADKLTLAAGSILGTLADCANPSSVNGVGIPLADQYVLIPSELTAITDAVASYNTAISGIVAANPTRLALADWYTAVNTWVTAGAVSANGIPVTASITPPLAGFSEDGIHPNGKGTAVLANVVIDAINATYGAGINKANVTHFKGTRTPVNP